MKYLLDAHTFIWWNINSARLSTTAFNLLQDQTNILLLSLATVWEMQIKVQLGKLTLPAPLTDVIAKQRQANQIELLSITLAHIYELQNLPDHHRDPFDRLLVAQATIEKIPVISTDAQIAKYPVKVIW